MRAWQVVEHGEPIEALRCVEVAEPDPGEGLVAIDVQAAALALPDVFMCRGVYPLTPGTRPFTPGQEVVGTVRSVGPDVEMEVGTRVMGVTAFYLGHGGFADVALAPAGSVHAAPDWLADDAAAGFVIAFETAWIGLAVRGGVEPGDTVVVLGAAGGTGSAALLVARALGARVVAVVAGEEKAGRCRALGADVVIDRTELDVPSAVLEATDGRGADLVYDPVGGAAAEESVRYLANGGRLLLVGFASGRWPDLPAHDLVRANASVVGVYAGAYTRAETVAMVAELLELTRSGRLAPLPTTVVGFDELPAALTVLAEGRVVGRTVLRVG